jgi:HAD superfamily hydrolase (TIGR01549 family)
MPYRTLTFDWGDTLASNSSMPYKATQQLCLDRLAQALRAAGSAPEADFSERCQKELAVDWMRTMDRVANPDHQEFDFRAMAEGWVQRVRTDRTDDTAAAAALAAMFDRMSDTVIPYAETMPVLTALQQRGYRIGILSHVPWPGDVCRRWYVRHGLAHLVDFYSLSSDVGWIKPNPRHFTHALAQANCAPGDILHIGDHPWRDVEGAKAAGFATALRLTQGIYDEAHLTSCGADHVILRLTDLLEILP